MKKTSIWRKLHRIWITVGAIFWIVFVVWSLLAARSHGGVPAWVIAGHSRGGVIAATLARDGFPSLAGVVLIGTSHPRDFALASAVSRPPQS